ncbi:unnamed protein product [Symbiodinium microadriaticum]|nr:unnamed protein product [Symbiodinium microadriaticum]
MTTWASRTRNAGLTVSGAGGSDFEFDEEEEEEETDEEDGNGDASEGSNLKEQPLTTVSLQRGSGHLDYFGDDYVAIAAFLLGCKATAPHGRVPRRRLRENGASVLELEIDSGERSIFSFGGIEQIFANLKQLLYKTTDCLRVVYDLRGFASCNNLKSLKLQLSFQTMCEDASLKCGLTALRPLAGTLEVLEIGRLRFNLASDLEVLKDFHQLRVLKYEGINEVTEGCRSVLDLRKLTLLQELEFTEASFTTDAVGSGSVDEETSDDEGFLYGMRPSLQVLIPPEHLGSITFKHQYGSRITPELRQMLRRCECLCQEFVPQQMAGSGTLNFVDGFKAQTGEEIESAEQAAKEKHRLLKERQRQQEQEKLTAALAKIGLASSHDGPFEAGEEVYGFDHYDLSFSRFSVESPTKRSTSWVSVTQKLPASRGSTAGVHHKVVHPSCVFRELPDLPNLQLCSGRGFNGNQVWRQRPPKRPHCDEDPSASPACELCGKQLRNMHGLRQHMRDKHPRA